MATPGVMVGLVNVHLADLSLSLVFSLTFSSFLLFFSFLFLGLLPPPFFVLVCV